MKTLERTNKKLDTLAQSQSRFIAGLSHDLRTPFAGLMGMIDLMLTKSKDPEVRGYGLAAQNAAKGLVQYFERIVEAEKVTNESSDQERLQSVVDLQAFVAAIVEIYLPTIKVKGLKLLTHATMHRPVNIVPDAVQTVLMNLIGNAVKYTDQGLIKIDIDVVQWRGHDMIAVRVSDTGPGISPSMSRKIFEPFYRIKGAEDGMIKGAGLGLTIAKKRPNKWAGHSAYFPLRMAKKGQPLNV